MTSKNYQKCLDKTLEQLKDLPEKKSLLLHACCGPCSSYVLEYLSNFFNITILYYNPNIYPKEEYERRRDELENLLKVFTPAVKNNVKLVLAHYESQEFYDYINIKNEPELAQEMEKGERCRRCYEMRLKFSYNYAKKHSFDYFCTSLSISPFKDSEKINIIGEEIQKSDLSGPKWLFSDFKKKGGFKRSLEISQEYNLYRQQYCGCVYSIQTSCSENSLNVL